MTPPAGISALILAAGHSSRMGGEPKALLPLGGSTLLGMAFAALREGGAEDIRVVTGAHAQAISAQAQNLHAALVHNPAFEQGMFSSVQAGLCALWTGGTPRPRAVLLLPVDGALVKPQSIAALIAAWNSLSEGERDWAVFVPSFESRLGHPVLFGAAHIPAILHAKEEGGLRAYFAGLLKGQEAKDFMRGMAEKRLAVLCSADRQPQEGQRLHSCLLDAPFYRVPAATAARSRPVHFLPLPDAGLICDIDRPEDLAKAQALLASTRNRVRPLLSEAADWLRNARLSERKIRHSIQVARGALRLGLALRKAGLPADLQLHACGGLLHDIARMHREHARVAHAWIEAFGWRECALAAGAHTVLPDSLLEILGIPLRDLPLNSKGELLTEISVPEGYTAPRPELLHACLSVFLADKHFSGEALVSLSQRFAAVREHFFGNGKVKEAISRREAVAKAVRDAAAAMAGRPVEALLGERCGHELESALDRFSDRVFL